MSSALSIPMRSDAEIEAAEAIILFSQRVVIFPPPLISLVDEDLYETDTDEEIFGPSGPGYRSRNTRTRVMKSVNDSKESAAQLEVSYTHTTPLVPMNITVVLEPLKPWFHELLTRSPLHEFVQFGLRASTLAGEAERRVAAFLEGLTVSDRNCVQEACWYLESCGWNVVLAIAGFRTNEKARERREKYLHAAANNLANQVTSTNYNTSHLSFLLVDSDGSSQVVATFARMEDFNQHNRAHIKALNQWRNDLTRKLKGPPSAVDFPLTLAKYSEYEVRFLRNSLASANVREARDIGKAAVMQNIVDDFNALFTGRYLPHANSPCGPRVYHSIKEYINREIVGRHTGNFSYRRTVLQMQQTREKEQAEFETLMAGNTTKLANQSAAEAVRARGPTLGAFEVDVWECESRRSSDRVQFDTAFPLVQSRDRYQSDGDESQNTEEKIEVPGWGDRDVDMDMG